MPGSNQIHRPEALPSEFLHGEHLQDLRRRERHERLDGNRRIGRNLQRDVENRFHTPGIGLDDFPRLGVRQILVADTCNVHGILQGFAETVVLDIGLERTLHGSYFRNCLTVIIIHLSAGRNLAAVIFLRKHQRTVDEISQHSDQLVVVAGLEILPCKVVILGFGGIGTQHIAQYILLSGELLQVFMQPHRPVARGRNLIALEVQELVGRHVLRQYIPPVRLEHRGEDDAVEHDIILADEMHHLGVFRLPVPFPIGRKVFRGGYVTDRSVEPHIEHLPFGTLHGHGDAPVEVTAHGTGLQSAVEPALALSVDIRLPLLMPIEYPLAEETFVLIQREIPVFRLPFDRNRPRHGAMRVDQLVGREGRPAFLALVAVGTLVPAFGTSTDDITVGKERLRLLVVILHGGLFDEFPLVVKFAEKFRRGRGMGRRRCPRIDIERHSQPLERLFDQVMVTIHDLLRGHPLLAGLYGDGHAVLVRSADRNHVAALQPQVTRVNIRRYINSRQMADMHRAVCIGESRCNEVTLELFCHIEIYSITNFCQN